MTHSPLVQAVHNRLLAVGYLDLSTPLKVAGVEFSFTAAMHGQAGRSLDLVLIFDTAAGEFGDRDAKRIRQKLDGLSRALDVTGSRYVVTAILAGPILVQSAETISETCRVLMVEDFTFGKDGKPVGENAQRALDDRIRVLLPLVFPSTLSSSNSVGGFAVEELFDEIAKQHPSKVLQAAIDASDQGSNAVADRIAQLIEAEFHSNDAAKKP